MEKGGKGDGSLFHQRKCGKENRPLFQGGIYEEKY